VKTTVSAPSVLMSLIDAIMPLAADLVASPRWWLIDSITSVESMVLPLWNSTPWRSLKVHCVASSEASQLSASSPIRLPSGAISVRQLRNCPKLTPIM